MLALEGKREDIKEPSRKAQRKLDGTRIMVIKDGENVKIMAARSWANDYASRYLNIVDDVRKLPVDRCVLDGELTFFEKGTDRDVFVNALSKPETKKDFDIKAMMFDVLWVDDDNLEHLPFKDRDEILKTLIPSGLRHVKAIKTVTKNKMEYFNQLKAKQGEGVVLKEEASPYRQGQRTSDWLKVKHWKDTDAVVVGYTRGQGSRAKTFGSIVLAQRDKQGNWHYIGKSSGFKEADIRRMLAKMKQLETSKSPLVDAPKDLNIKAWVKPQIVAQVKYYERTPYNILRFPDFIRERSDKKPSECLLPKP